MEEATVQLLCPECGKDWQEIPRALPDLSSVFHCPSCHASRHTSEFMRTDRDLRALKQLG